MFEFKHTKSPAWCADSAHSIYFKVFLKTDNSSVEEIGYIGFQENDFGRGLCNNMCYRTYDSFRNKGLTKKYIKEFLDEKILNLECIRAKTPKNNIASQKVLEYAGFEKMGPREEGAKIGYTWKAF